MLEEEMFPSSWTCFRNSWQSKVDPLGVAILREKIYQSSIRFRWYLAPRRTWSTRLFRGLFIFMSDLIPKKERRLWYWLQGVTIVISLIASWLAFYASVKSAEVSWKLSKENEKETRLWTSRFDFYNKLNNTVTSFQNQEINYLSWLEEQMIDFNKKLWGYDGELFLISSPEVYKRYTCLRKSLEFSDSSLEDMLILESYNEDLLSLGYKKTDFFPPNYVLDKIWTGSAREMLWLWFNISTFDYVFLKRIRPNLILLIKAMREDLYGNSSEITIQPITWKSSNAQWETEDQFKKRMELAKNCETIDMEFEASFYK